jgi:hypothetical protein
MRPALEVADIVRAHGDEFRQAHAASLSTQHRRVLRSIELCRTAALGGHLERCDQCGHERNAYNSCADRHCPKCQSLARAKWLEKRQAELLPCEYFHVVFTLPAPLAPLALQNKRQMYDLLFRADPDLDSKSLYVRIASPILACVSRQPTPCQLRPRADPITARESFRDKQPGEHTIRIESLAKP